MPIPALRLLSVDLARHWLMALIISVLTVFAASYFYFTATHHHLAADGVVADKTASAINEFSPRPSILSYAGGFVNSKLALAAKSRVAALMIAVTIACLLLRAARDGSSSLLRVRRPRADYGS